MVFAPARSDPAPFQPGYTFASRYRLVERHRRDGRGEIWRVDDLVLGVPVALQLVTATNEAERDSITRRVRLARELTDPAVCRIFDVGEAEGRIYFTSELVNGETLDIICRRAGRLPSEKVVEIGRQLCGGLAAIHAQGVLHGAVSAGTVLLDQHGAVRLTEIALVAPDATAAEDSGTVAAGAGRPRSEADDIYDVGAVLYELLAGVQPDAQANGRPLGRPSKLVADVDPRLERVIMQALASDPRVRPASAAEMAAALAMVSPGRGNGFEIWIAGAGVAAVVVALAGLTNMFIPSAPAALTARDTIMLADFVNTTGKPVFDGALKVALAVALEQSPFLQIFPDDRAKDTLRLMQHDPAERITRGLAREIAQRQQLKALVAGSIGSLGDHYVLALEAIEASTGEVMAREQVDVATDEEVLTALGAATARLREGLGESLGSIERFDAPLPQATTASLEALHAYALALDQGRVVPRVEAIPHLRRAIELDPEFAMAHAALSGIYWNTGRSSEAPDFSRRAFELRDRVSERERFFISWRYYVDAVQAWDEALKLALSWTRTYPRESFAFNSLGLASAAFGDHEQAVGAFREAIRLDPAFVPPHGNLAGSLLALDRFTEAEQLLTEANQRGIGFITVRRMSYLLASVKNDGSAAARELDLVRKSSDAAWASVWEARTAAFSGRFSAAHVLFQRGVRDALRDGANELAAQWMVEDAEAHAIAGDCTLARGEARASLERSRDNFTLERAARSFALCGDSEEASRLAAELTARFPGATLTTRLQVPVISAADALRYGDAARALELLEPVKPYDHAPSAEFWPAYLRGEAYLQQQDGGAAAEQFQAILEHRGERPTSPLYPLAHLGLGRANAVAGKAIEARSSYQAGFSLLKGADPDVPPVKEARAAYARLE
jgi:tetratricopeptide (TPR) repeat protein